MWWFAIHDVVDDHWENALQWLVIALEHLSSRAVIGALPYISAMQESSFGGDATRKLGKRRA